MTDDPRTAAESARRALARFELAAIRHRNVVRARLGLGDDELTTLLYLQEHSPLTQRQLVEISTLTRSGVGAMVHRLEEAGLIERVPDPRDRRVRLLQLSAGGWRRLRESTGERDAEVERLLVDRPVEQLQAFTRLLTAVADATQRHAGADDDAADHVRARPNPDWRRWG